MYGVTRRIARCTRARPRAGGAAPIPPLYLPYISPVSPLYLAQAEREAQAELLLAVMARGERQHAPCAAGLAALAQAREPNPNPNLDPNPNPNPTPSPEQALEPGHLGPLLEAALFADAPSGRAAAMRALALVPALKGLLYPAEGVLAARLWLLRLDADVSHP